MSFWLAAVLRGKELFKRIVRVDLHHVRVAVNGCSFEQCVMDGLEGGCDVGNGFVGGWEAFVFRTGVSTGEGNGSFFEVAWTDLDANRHTFFNPLPAFGSAADVALIYFYANGMSVERLGLQAGCELFCGVENRGPCFFFGGDGDDDDLGGGDARGEDDAVVIAVGHNDGADEAGADSPAGGPCQFLGVGAGDELDAAGFGEVLSEEVGRTGLDGFPVLDHGLDAEGLDGTGETFACAFLAGDDGEREVIASEGLVDFEHLLGFFTGFLFGFVSGVAFLPEELGGAEEHAGPHFPADDIGPLVDEDGEVAVALDPFGVGGADDGFAGGPNDEGFCECGGGGGAESAFGGGFEAVVGDDCAFFGEAFDVFGFFCEVGQGDEEGEVGVFVTGCLEHCVKVALHVFPESVTPGFDDHATAHV